MTRGGAQRSGEGELPQSGKRSCPGASDAKRTSSGMSELSACQPEANDMELVRTPWPE